MAKNQNIYFTQEGHLAQVVGLTALTDIFTAGANGAKLLSIYIPTGVTGSLSLYIRESGGSNVDLFNIQDPSPSVNLLATGTVLPSDSRDNVYINIPAGATLVASANVAVTVRAYYEDY